MHPLLGAACPAQNLSGCLESLRLNLYRCVWGQRGRYVCVRAFIKQDIYWNLLTKKKEMCVLNSRCSLQSQVKMEGHGQLLGSASFRWDFLFFLSRNKERMRERKREREREKETPPGLLP